MMKRLILTVIVLTCNLGIFAQVKFNKTYDFNAAFPPVNVGTSVSATSDDGYIVLLETSTPTQSGGVDVVKFDALGLVQWAKQITNPTTNQSIISYKDPKSNIVELPNGNGFALLVGLSDVNNGTEGFCLLGIDNNGNVLWQRAYGGYTNGEIHGCKLIVSGNSLVIAGNLRVDHNDPDDSNDIFLAKYDLFGNLNWAYRYGNIIRSSETTWDFKETTNKEYLITGETGSILQGTQFIVKTDNDGTLLWSRVYAIGDRPWEEPKTIIPTTTGSIFIAGWDYLLKTNASGSPVFCKSYSYPNRRLGFFHGIHSSDAQLVFSGVISNGTYPGSPDFWTVKLNPFGNVVWSFVHSNQNSWNIGRHLDEANDMGYIFAGRETDDPTIPNQTNFANLELIKSDQSGKTTCEQPLPIQVGNIPVTTALPEYYQRSGIREWTNIPMHFAVDIAPVENIYCCSYEIEVESPHCITDESYLKAPAGFVSYNWTTPTSSILNGSSVLSPPLAPGKYFLEATDANGCIATAEYHLYHGQVEVTFAGPPTSLCEGDQYCFVAPNIWDPTNTVGTWTFQGGTPSTAPLNNPCVTYPNAGVYDATLTITNPCGTFTHTEKVVVAQRPKVEVIGQLIYCEGDLVTLEANSQLGDVILWTFENGTTMSGSTISFTAGSVPYYGITVTATNSSTNCAAQQAFSVQVIQAPNAGPDVYFCPDKPVTPITLEVQNPAPGFTYTWTGGGVNLTGSSVTVTPAPPVTYTLTSTHIAGCQFTDEVSVNFSTGPSVTVGPTSKSQQCGFNIPAFPTGGNPPYTFAWSSGANTPLIAVNPFNSTSYAVTVTDNHGCSTQGSLNVDPDPLSQDLDDVELIHTISLTPNDPIFTVYDHGMGPNDPSYAYGGATEYEMEFWQGFGGVFKTVNGQTSSFTGFPNGHAQWDGTDNNGNQVQNDVYNWRFYAKNCRYSSFWGIDILRVNNPGTSLTGTVHVAFRLFVAPLDEAEDKNVVIEPGIFPNPTSGGLNVNLQLDNYDNTSLQLYDMTGRLVLDKSHLEATNFVELTGLADGNFILHVNYGEQTVRKKITLVRE